MSPTIPNEVQRESGNARALGGRIRVGIGGWSYEPWRETFYPRDVPKKNELHYASRHVTAIEINSTFYRLQNPNVFAKWRDETPEDFVFSIKAPRHIVQRRALAQGAESLQRFLNSGLAQLRGKLGPILWQLPPEKQFDHSDLQAFLKLLPDSIASVPLRHALEVRHESFRCAAFVDLAREYRITIVFTHSRDYPAIADLTGDFVYARLREAVASETTGYPPREIARWADRAQAWAAGKAPDDLSLISPASSSSGRSRDVFVYFINGAKERAPAAAMTLLATLNERNKH